MNENVTISTVEGLDEAALDLQRRARKYVDEVLIPLEQEAELLALRLLAQDLEALEHRDARADHRRQLAREDHDLFALAHPRSGPSVRALLLGPHRLARLGHHPFTVRTGVRIPVGTPIFSVTQVAENTGNTLSNEYSPFCFRGSVAS